MINFDNVGSVKTSHLDYLFENLLNIWSIWSWEWPTSKKLTLILLNMPLFTSMLKQLKTIEFLFSLAMLYGCTYSNGGRIPCQECKTLLMGIRFSSLPLGHNRVIRLCTEKQKWTERRHKMLTWKTQQMWEKPRQPTDCKKSLWEEYNEGET